MTATATAAIDKGRGHFGAGIGAVNFRAPLVLQTFAQNRQRQILMTYRLTNAHQFFDATLAWVDPFLAQNLSQGEKQRRHTYQRVWAKPFNQLRHHGNRTRPATNHRGPDLFQAEKNTPFQP